MQLVFVNLTNALLREETGSTKVIFLVSSPSPKLYPIILCTLKSVPPGGEPIL